MNAINFISATVALFFSISISAQKNITVYNNSDELAKTKEYTLIDKNESKVLSKVKYTFDDLGQRINKISYSWNSTKGWIASDKYEYKYNDKKKLEELSYTKWDSKINDWSEKSDRIIHIYDSNGILFSTEEIQIENSKENLLTYNK